MNKEDIPLNERLMFQRQKLAFVMGWGTLIDKKTSFFFIDEGVKVNQHVYLKAVFLSV